MILKAFSVVATLILFSGALFSEDWVGSYDSAAIEEHQGDVPVYPLSRIENLRKPISPRYVRVLDWKTYGEGGKLLQKGILFTYQALRSSDVALAGDFSGWQGKPMKRNKNGIFYYILPVRETEEGNRILTYRYKFLSGGIWFPDPSNRVRTDDGLGGSVSVYELPQEDINRQVTLRTLREKKPGRERLIEFAVHEGALARALRKSSVKNVSIVGDFNSWNPDHDWMNKGEDGIYRLRMRLSPGEYSYRLVVDGNWILDPFNPETRKHLKLEDLVSYAVIR